MLASLLLCLLAGDARLDDLISVYATVPVGYPAGAAFTPPDRSVPFRWHGFHRDAIATCDDARMRPFVAPFNPLEDTGVAMTAGGVTTQFVAEHATHGQRALQVTFSKDAIASEQAIVRVQCIAGEPSYSTYLRQRSLMTTASCYGPHFRWFKIDVFNPSREPRRVRVSAVPFVVAPGASTIAVKLVDAVERGYACSMNSVPIEVTSRDSGDDVTLFFDHARMEQEVPDVLSRSGRLLQFPARAEPRDPPVVWPGFMPVETDTLYSTERGYGWTEPAKTRVYQGHSFRSYENGLLWGHCSRCDAPLRIDLPAGKYSLAVIGAPQQAAAWNEGTKLRVNGHDERLLAPRSADELRRTALSGETWDYRPGVCVWEELVRPVFYPPLELVTAESDGKLEIEFPPLFALHALIVFPLAEREEAVRELGRLNYLLAESWDVSHPWIKANYARQTLDGRPYIGAHDEQTQPESIPDRLRALPLTDGNFVRGFVAFTRGLTAPVYPDTIPTPDELRDVALRAVVAPGQTDCVTLGLLPLRTVTGLRAEVSELKGSGVTLGRERLDVRVSRYHQKTLQFGHHNHDYNYQEHYLVVRPSIDLHPGAARRIYVDIAVPADATPGEYRGRITLRSARGDELQHVPIVLEVLPLRLDATSVYFASNCPDPRLTNYGFNTFATSRDDAVAHGYRGYLANCGHAALSFDGAKFGWDSLLNHADRLRPLIEAGRSGREPRGFLGGPAPGTHGRADADRIADEFFTRVRAELPRLDLPGVTWPVFHLGGEKSLQFPHEWVWLAGRPREGTAEALANAQRAGGDFFFIDGLRHSKEHAARFTFGVWLWRLGATGRFTTTEALLQYGGGTARPALPLDPYFTLLDVTTCNMDRAIHESLTPGVFNPTRDLLLLRAGIDDYRYLHTLDNRLRAAEAHAPKSPAVQAARRFRDELFSSVSLDLRNDYITRAGAYAENWYAKPTAWSDDQFTSLRRDIARHIAAIGKLRGQVFKFQLWPHR
jgi:hypothetical protein